MIGPKIGAWKAALRSWVKRIRKTDPDPDRAFSRLSPTPSPASPAVKTAIGAALVLALAAVLACGALMIFTSEQMIIVWPVLTAFAVFLLFAYFLRVRAQAPLFGEIGFVYLVIALAYTISPAVVFLLLKLSIPREFDQINFAVLSPRPGELGLHFWRHTLFIAGVALGYLAARGRPSASRPEKDASPGRFDGAVVLQTAIIGGCILLVTAILPPAKTYLEHYTRFNGLPSPLRMLVNLLLIFKYGGYFVLMALLFSRYRRYKKIIFVVVPILCAYEVVFSYGSRIVALNLLIAFIGFYHFRVKPIGLGKSVLLVMALAVVFYGIGVVRSYSSDLEEAKYRIRNARLAEGSELETVYSTGFHLYLERKAGSLPARKRPMFFHDLLAIVPFIDHTENHPLYWYARNYFPSADVPPTTMGVIAESALWGGEWDLLLRSLFNGAIFALLARWFQRRRDEWWALTIYIYCFATCILTFKHSVLYQLEPLCRVILPPLLLTAAYLRLKRIPGSGEAAPSCESD